MDITFGAVTPGGGDRADGRGHLIPGMFGGDPLTSLTATATACIRGVGYAADALT